MFQIPQQFTSAGTAQLDAQFQLLHKLHGKAFDHAEQLLALHAEHTRAALDKATLATRQLLAAKDPRAFFTLAAAQIGPALEQLSHYGKQWFSVAGSAGVIGGGGKALSLVAPAQPVLALAAPSTAPVEQAPAAPVALVATPAPETVIDAVRPAPPAPPAPAEAAAAPAVAAKPAPVAAPKVTVAKVAPAVKPAAAATEPKQRDTMSVKASAKPKK